jgi:hypothetical protein
VNKGSRNRIKGQEHCEKSGKLEKQCYQFLRGLLGALNANIDRRLVETFLALVLVNIMHRHRNQGLVLSELGGRIHRNLSVDEGG